MNIKTLQSFYTECSADTVEWCPYPNYQQFLLCGTYHLEENNSKELQVPARRKGHIYLFEYNAKRNDFAKVDLQETAAILDQKWTKLNATADPIIGAASALGEVILYSLRDSRLHFLSSVVLDPEQENLLACAIDWNAEQEPDRKLVVSDSKGHMSLLQLRESSLSMVSTWMAHSFEAWTCAFDKHNSNIVYTGGDDMCLNVFDTRLAVRKVLTNKVHRAGVTTMLSFGDVDHNLVTGSYDDILRLFDTRNFKAAMTEVNLGGGIWRIKQNPFDKNLLLCACMYHNFSIVQMDASWQNMDVVGEYFEHKSICYGADWCHQKLDDDEVIMATCSFYDRKLGISRVSKML